jgi:hypothetical protein
MSNDIVVIADTQVIKGAPLEHIHALAKYIWEVKPAHLVHIGDHWDFKSLSSFSSELEREGMRLQDDMAAGTDSLHIITDYIKARNAKCKKSKYKPALHFCMGNHEHRLQRYIECHPVLAGFVDLEHVIESAGWTVHPFLQPVFINEVCFVHYLQNTASSRAVGGSIENKLNKFPHSFVHGHQQQYQFGRRQNLLGRPHFGVCAGSFYIHDEGYRGANNTEIRGFAHLKSFTNRYDYLDYDVDFVSLERLLENYG